MSMWNWGQPTNGIIQIAYLGEDTKGEIKPWGPRLNLGPWFLFEHFEFQWLKYRGTPCELDVTLALTNSGHMTIELIQQNDVRPSVYQEIRERRGFGFHHWAVGANPADYDRVLAHYEKQGYAIALEAAVAVGARAAYVDTSPDLGGMIEIIEETPALEALVTLVQQVSVGWRGS